MNIWKSWVVTWETHLPTAFLLVYWWRDDTEELGLTLYKASPSAASHSFKHHCCSNFSCHNSRTGNSRETSTLPSIMSEVGIFYVLKQKKNRDWSNYARPARANAQRGAALMRDLTARRAVVDGFIWTDEISHPTFTVAAPRIWLISVRYCTAAVSKRAGQHQRGEHQGASLCRGLLTLRRQFSGLTTDNNIYISLHVSNLTVWF